MELWNVLTDFIAAASALVQAVLGGRPIYGSAASYRLFKSH